MPAPPTLEMTPPPIFVAFPFQVHIYILHISTCCQTEEVVANYERGETMNE